MTHISLIFYSFSCYPKYTHTCTCTQNLSFPLPSSHFLFPSGMNLPLIQGSATFKTLNQNVSNSLLSMIIPSSFQQLMSSCLKNPLILHKFPPSAKKPAWETAVKKEMCASPSSSHLRPRPAFHPTPGVLVARCSPAPFPGELLADLHSLAPAPQPTKGHPSLSLPQPQITRLYISLTYEPSSQLIA